MRDFRIYILNRERHFIGVESIAAESEPDAVERASTFVTSEHGVEIWERADLIATLPHLPRLAS